ncbi:hypothetical protein STHU_20690 [Allostella humosa]|nr:hypothetical protein STHU_20690 [Stella humosa]
MPEKTPGASLLREMIRFVARRLMDVGEATGAARGERSRAEDHRPPRHAGGQGRGWGLYVKVADTLRIRSTRSTPAAA